MIRIFASALIATTMLSAAPASADDAPVSKAVSYGDLNLASSAGLKSLQFRVNAAIHSVCGDPDQRDLTAMALSERCRVQARASSATQIAAVVSGQRQTAARATNIKMASR